METAAAVAVPAATVLMSEDEARAAVARIKRAAEDLCALLFDLKEREGWRALGYETWGECIRTEFQMSRQHAHRLINSHIVERVLAPMLVERVSPAGDTPTVPETHARQLAPLLDRPDDLRAAYADALEATDGKPTEQAVHDAVDRKLGRQPKPIRPERAVRSGRTAETQDIPDDLAFTGQTAPDETMSPAGDDFSDVVNNEPKTHGVPERFCSTCGDRYRGDACPCATADDEYPRASEIPCSACGGEITVESEAEDRALGHNVSASLKSARCKACRAPEPAPRTSSVSLGRPPIAPTRTVAAGPAPLTIQGDAGDAMRAVADRWTLDRIAEGIGETYSEAERRSLAIQLIDALPTPLLDSIKHRVDVRVRTSTVAAPTSFADIDQAIAAHLTVEQQTALVARTVNRWDTDAQRRVFEMLAGRFGLAAV